MKSFKFKYLYIHGWWWYQFWWQWVNLTQVRGIIYFMYKVIWWQCADKPLLLLQGFIIAFTSDFIPHLVYAITVSPNHNLEGFLDFSLSVFNTSDLEPGSEPYNSSYTNVEVCRSVHTWWARCQFCTCAVECYFNKVFQINVWRGCFITFLSLAIHVTLNVSAVKILYAISSLWSGHEDKF